MQLLTSAQTHRHTMQMQFDQAIIYLQEFLKNDILISPNMQNILQIQLNALKQLPPILPHTAMLDLPDEQYRVLNTIITSLGSTSSKKWPYFFITGSAGTGKSYLIKMILNWLNQRKNKYLLLAPTGVAAQNIGGFTIHSALRITQSESGFQTLAYHDPEFRNGLLKMETIIIDEISMVPASLFTFMANMFGRIHGNDMAFGGINVIAVGDLAQLPPVRASPVFHSSVWHLFYPLFLRQPKRQHQDESFYRMLEEIRLGNISQNTWNKLLQKAAIYQTDMSLDNILTITHVVGHRRTADMINRVICNVLPIENECFLISEAIDFQNGVQASSKTLQAEFKTKTNLPLIVRLQQGARVMFLNNSLISEGICNGTIGIVVCVDKSIPKVQIAFCVRETIVLKWVTQQTSYFYAFGQHASRTQFPLQNSFALTIHKTQGITLQHVSLALDSQIFSPGQTYVAISRCPTWDKVCISSIHRDAFITDPEVINEYERLERIASQKLPIV
jgi:ATP-dependent exoDNAse (exonuclease V) alpha subunit